MIGSLLLALTLVAPAADAARSFAAFLGAWVSASGAAPVTMRWEDRGGGIVYVSAVNGAGVPIESFTVRQDGKDYPYSVRGGSLVSTIAASPVDARTVDVTFKMTGQDATSRSRWGVSADGRTLSVGRPDGTTLRLTRSAAGTPLQAAPLKSGYKRYIGVWRAVQVRDGADTGSVVWEDRGEDFVVATVRNKAGEVTMRYSLKYDGKEYTCLTAGSKGGIGTIHSVFTDEYTTDWTLSTDGKAYNSGSRIVSRDGQMMTVPIGTNTATGNDLVWRRQKDAPTDGVLTK